MAMRVCPSCSVQTDTKDINDVGRMMKCLMCREDIVTGGNRGGIGAEAMRSLVLKHGRIRVKAQYEFHRDGPKKKAQRPYVGR